MSGEPAQKGERHEGGFTPVGKIILTILGLEAAVVATLALTTSPEGASVILTVFLILDVIIATVAALIWAVAKVLGHIAGEPQDTFATRPLVTKWVRQLKAAARNPKEPIGQLRLVGREPKKLSFRGRHGKRAFFGKIDQPSSEGRDTAAWEQFEVRAPFSPQLDLGLLLTDSPNNHPNEIPFGDDNDFAARFEVFAVEEERARSLLTRSIRADLLRLKEKDSPHLWGQRYWVQIDDKAVTLATSAKEVDAPDLVRIATELAEKLYKTTKTLKNAARITPSQIAMWKQLAQEHDWALTTTPLRMKGQVEAGQLTLGILLQQGKASPRDPKSFTYERRARLRFDEPLNLGIRLGSAGWSDRLKDLFSKEAVTTGDALFDDTFRVCATDPEGSKQLLTSKVRKALLRAHHDVDPVWLDDCGIELREPKPEANAHEMIKLVPALDELARLIQEARPDARKRNQGPYR